jgi:hypothetical protein
MTLIAIGAEKAIVFREADSFSETSAVNYSKIADT